MSTDGETPKAVLEHRRWLIGISITVVFGIFGVVMALLAYSDRAKPPASTPAVVKPDAPPARGHGDKDKGHGREN